MGLNAFFTYGVVLGLGHSWQVALGAVFLSGLLFVGLSLLPVREWIINSIPMTLKLAISARLSDNSCVWRATVSRLDSLPRKAMATSCWWCS